MKPPLAIIVGGMVLLAMLSVAPIAMADEYENGDDSSSDIQPGERMAGVAGIQSAEFGGELTHRAYGLQIAQAATDDSARGAVVAGQLDNIEERMSSLEERKESLQAERDQGNISAGQYRAKMAQLTVEQKTMDRLTNQSGSAAQGLPDHVREAHRINMTAIDTLRDRAHALTGPETAEIAQSIAGPHAGNDGPTGPIERGPPDRNGGPPAEPGQQNRSAAE